MATFAALLQVCFIYWFTWALKTDASWRVDGTAVGYALSIDQLNRPSGALAAGLPRFDATADVCHHQPGTLGAADRSATVLAVALADGAGFYRLPLDDGIVPDAGHLYLDRADRVAALCADRRVEHGSKRAWMPSGCARAGRAPSPKFVALCRRAGMRAPRAQADSSFARFTAAGLWRRFSCFTSSPGTCARSTLTATNLTSSNAGTGSARGCASIRCGACSRRSRSKRTAGSCLPVTLENGKKVDLIADGAPVKWTEPPNLSRTFRDAQWQKYYLNLWSLENAPHRGYFVAYMVRQWNENHRAPGARQNAATHLYAAEQSRRLSQR